MANPFVPTSPTSLSAAPDGMWVAVVEPGGITVVDPRTGQVHGEVGVAPDATCDVGWADQPSRLVVVQQHADHSLVHLVDVTDAPTPHGEVRVEHPVHVVASGAQQALLAGGSGALVARSLNDRLAVGEFPTNAPPTCGGPFGLQHVVVATAGALEEWDLNSRMARRRFRLPGSTVRHVGGTEREVWMVTEGNLARVEVVPLVNRGQPRAHDLAEPVAAISAHPRVELVVYIGATTGQAHVIDLQGKGRGRPIGRPGQKACALVARRGQVFAVLATPGAPLAIEVLDGRGVEPPAPLPPPPVTDLGPTAAIATAAVDRAVAAADRLSGLGDGPSPTSSRELAQRLRDAPLALEELEEHEEHEEPRTTPDETPERKELGPTAPAAAVARGASWRDQLIAWARGTLAGNLQAAPRLEALDQLGDRIGVPDALDPAIALLYGAHLLGHDGVAAADLAQVLTRSWDEALGSGQLAALGVARWQRSRVRLSPEIRDALDERPPRHGKLVTTDGTVFLVVRKDADAKAAELEAKARGAIPQFEERA